MRKIYGKTLTSVWVLDYPKYYEICNNLAQRKDKLELLRVLKIIAETREYNISCISSRFMCFRCEFGKEAGICENYGSTFDKFIRKLRETINRLEVEEHHDEN